MPKTDLRSKFLGAMVGSALGDAIGQMAFRDPQKDSLSDALESTPEYRYTDDTAMAIGLAESLTKMRRVDQEDLGQTFRDHFNREPWRGYASGPPIIFSLVSQTGMTYTEPARLPRPWIWTLEQDSLEAHSLKDSSISHGHRTSR